MPLVLPAAAVAAQCEQSAAAVARDAADPPRLPPLRLVVMGRLAWEPWCTGHGGVVRWCYATVAHWSRYRGGVPTRTDTMATWPPKPGMRSITLEIDRELLAQLDARVRERTCSRAAYLRQLIIDDIKAARTV